MDTDIPFYLQVKRHIKNKIKSGELQPGDVVPSERKLKKKFGLSRSTVRKALDQLVYEDYLKRVQGKGTFVSKKDLVSHLNNIRAINLRREESESNQVREEKIAEDLIVYKKGSKKHEQIDLDAISEEKIYRCRKRIIIENNMLDTENIIGLRKIYSIMKYAERIKEIIENDIKDWMDKIVLEMYIKYASDSLVRKLNLKGKKPLLICRETIYKDERRVIFIKNILNDDCAILKHEFSTLRQKQN